MKFGIFYELQLPRPWEDGDELRLYQNALTQLETADRLGYDHAYGWWNIISWKNIHIRRRRNRFWPRPPSAPRRSGSGTAFFSSPPTIPPALPSALRCSTS